MGETGLEVSVCGNDSGFIVVVIMMIKNLQNFCSWEQEKEKKGLSWVMEDLVEVIILNLNIKKGKLSQKVKFALILFFALGVHLPN